MAYQPLTTNPFQANHNLLNKSNMLARRLNNSNIVHMVNNKTFFKIKINNKC